MNSISLRDQLENRLLEYSKNIHDLVKKLPRDKINLEYSDQLNRSSCSIGANYIEANEAESRKDFFHRIKICRKESKESRYWLNIILYANSGLRNEIQPLILESTEYVKLFSATLRSQISK